ncbi:MAG: hypothetical protein LKG22_14150 [Sphingobium sp.]|jgi:hypothetical protein|nr:hypothetical protein [Sphingobium sp.]
MTNSTPDAPPPRDISSADERRLAVRDAARRVIAREGFDCPPSAPMAQI